MKGEQLALPVQLPQTPSFDSFFPGPNTDVVASLQRCAAGHGLPAVWLYGAPGSGKTHLLRAALCVAGADAAFVPLRTEAALPASLLAAPLLALDDADAVVGDDAFALPLLRLLDQRRIQGRPTLLAASAAPARLRVALPDLLTRLSAMALLGLKPLQETDRRALLTLHAESRGLELQDDAAHWLLTRLPRDAGSLIGALDALDRASLSAKRRLTVPFLQQVLVGRREAEGLRGVPSD